MDVEVKLKSIIHKNAKEAKSSTMIKRQNTKRWLIFAIFMGIVSLSATLHAAPIPVIHNRINNDNEGYSLNLLKLALSYHGNKYVTQPTEESYSQTKQMEEIKFGGISVLWAGTSRELEEELQPVRIPLFKGLLGSRIFIIRHDMQHLFNDIRTLEDLKKVRLGQGTTWADTQILKAADLNVVTAHKYDSLFFMLEGGRFDAYPRGVHEPWAEIIRHKDLRLIVEKNIMVIYRMPLYFFVGPGNIRLANDIESGLNQAIADGSFDQLFFSNSMIKETLKSANMDDRIKFYLDNPYAHPKTPVDRPELWYN